MTDLRNAQSSMGVESSYLPRIAELTERLSPSPTVQEYIFESGMAVANGLLKIPKVAIATMHLSGGAEFPRHKHDCIEFVIVYDGEVVVGCDEEGHRLKVGDIFKIAAGTGHTCRSVGDSSIVVITVPADIDYPSGDHHV